MSWQELYNHPDNSAFRRKRPNPDLIQPGDVLAIPQGRKSPAKVEFSLYVRRYAPFKSFGGGFEGDGRGFSTSLEVSSRTIGVATFGPALGDKVTGAGDTSGSSWVGPWEIRNTYSLGSIGKSKGDVVATILKAEAKKGTISFTLYTEGNLPLKDLMLKKGLADAVNSANAFVRPNSRPPQGTPDIDTFVDFSATFEKDHLVFKGVVRGDGFPNAEVFVMDSSSQVVSLLDYRTSSNEAGPLHRLFGAHATNRLGAFDRQVELTSAGLFGKNASEPPTVVQEI
jgi:hypothetical protein